MNICSSVCELSKMLEKPFSPKHFFDYPLIMKSTIKLCKYTTRHSGLKFKKRIKSFGHPKKWLIFFKIIYSLPWSKKNSYSIHMVVHSTLVKDYHNISYSEQ